MVANMDSLRIPQTRHFYLHSLNQSEYSAHVVVSNQVPSLNQVLRYTYIQLVSYSETSENRTFTERSSIRRVQLATGIMSLFIVH